MIARLSGAVVVGALLFALAACGFRPLYGESAGGSAANLGQIRIDTIADRRGQQLHNMLLDRMNPQGPPARPSHVLAIRLTESRQELAIRRDESATRANLTITAHFTLAPTDSRDRRHYIGSATSTNSFNRLRSDFATLSAEQDARTRALRTLAEEIRLRVAAALENPDAFMVARPAQPPVSGAR